jgi:ABC-type uncharacterized transport system permease subunit
MPNEYMSAAGDIRPHRSTSGAMWLSVPTLLVVRCVMCCLMTRLRPRSAIFAHIPSGWDELLLLLLLLHTSTLRAF